MIGGRYEVTRTVAAGANTLIAAATDTELDRPVTVKLVRPELSESEDFRRRFRAEMERIVGVSHPNIGAIYDWGEQRIGKRATVYVIGESLTGGSLRDLFDRGRLLTPSQALMVGLDACRGLDFAHQNGLVHTELTPSKLVFGDDRRLRIVDFGLARILGEEEWREPSRVATHVARYASPEQAQGLDVDGKTDVYSLALILIEAVTGSVPFAAESTVATLAARVGRLMPVDADLGPLASVLEHAGRPEPAERSTAAQFGRALVQAAPKMTRPAPIPMLTTSLFVQDPSAMRRPDDPTGGIARPPAEPEPVLVPPASGTDGPPPEPTAPSPTDPDPADAGGAVAVAERGIATSAAAAAVTTQASPATTAEFDDLAALVERTPKAPPPEDRVATDQPATPARKLSRKERRAARKTAAAPAASAAGAAPSTPADRAAGAPPLQRRAPRQPCRSDGDDGWRGWSGCSCSPSSARWVRSPGCCSAHRPTPFPTSSASIEMPRWPSSTTSTGRSRSRMCAAMPTPSRVMSCAPHRRPATTSPRARRCSSSCRRARSSARSPISPA